MHGYSIDHLGIAVKNLESAKKFYESIGMQVMPNEVIEAEGVKLAMVTAGESRIELLEPLNEKSPIAKFLDKRGEGLHHVALHVQNLQETVDRMKANGTQFISDEIKIGAGGHLYVFVHPKSAGGVLMELVQEAPANV